MGAEGENPMQPPVLDQDDKVETQKDKYFEGSKAGVIQLQPKNWVHDVKVVSSNNDGKKESRQNPSPPT
jgi:hypothetical protein